MLRQDGQSEGTQAAGAECSTNSNEDVKRADDTRPEHSAVPVAPVQSGLSAILWLKGGSLSGMKRSRTGAAMVGFVQWLTGATIRTPEK